MSNLTKPAQLNQDVLDSCRAVHESWNQLTRTWTFPTIHALGLKEPAGFNELKHRIEGISATSLAERLTQLENLGVVQRRVHTEKPLRVEYSLTVRGHELQKILEDLEQWSKRWAGKEPNSKEFIVAK